MIFSFRCSFLSLSRSQSPSLGLRLSLSRSLNEPAIFSFLCAFSHAVPAVSPCSLLHPLCACSVCLVFSPTIGAQREIEGTLTLSSLSFLFVCSIYCEFPANMPPNFRLILLQVVEAFEQHRASPVNHLAARLARNHRERAVRKRSSTPPKPLPEHSISPLVPATRGRLLRRPSGDFDEDVFQPRPSTGEGLPVLQAQDAH